MSFSFTVDKLSVGGGTFFMVEESDIWSGITEERVSLNDVSMRVVLSKESDRVRISSIEIGTPSLPADFALSIDDAHSVTRVLVNGDDILREIEPLKLSTFGNSLLPELRFARDKPAARSAAFSSGSPVYQYVRTLLRELITRSIGDTTVANVASKLLGHGPPSLEHLVRLGDETGKAVSKTFRALADGQNEPMLRRLTALLYAAWLPSLMRGLHSYLRSVLSSTLYIGPMRARSERYYRYQDLAVSEIDPDGKNFPMFLNSLTARQIDDFSAWVERLFGYGVRVARQTGHISINLVNEGVATNIVDVGYGVSQILPVLGQIWWARARPLSNENRPALALLAIEQPELHLHPAHQALLADALVGEAAPPSHGPRRPMNYLVETHSETLVNRFGEFIAMGRLAPRDVQVIIFDAIDGNSTRVRTVNFDDDGALIDWPYGFFQPVAI